MRDHRIVIQNTYATLGLFVAVLISGCTTPANVKLLSSQSRQEARMLGTVHEQTIQAFSDFTQEVEDKGRPLIALAQDRHTRLGQAGYMVLATKVDLAEARLLAKFDADTAALVGPQFDAAMQTNFWGVIGERKKVLEGEKLKFSNESAGAPNDIAALKRFKDKDLELLHIDQLALEKELELRSKIADRLKQSRLEYAARVRAMLDPLRVDSLAKVSGISLTNLLVVPDLKASGVSTNLSLKAARADLAAFRTKVNEAYASHQESLEGLRDYLNRPGVSQLLIAGMFQAVGDLLKSKLPALGSWGDTLLEAAQPLLSKAEEGLNSTVAEGEKLVTTSVNKMADELGKSTKAAATELTAPTK